MGSVFGVGLTFSVVRLLLVVPVGVLLLRAYGRTKMSGFGWLFAALVIWPVVAGVLSVLGPMLLGVSGAGLRAGLWNPMLLLSLGEVVIGGVLLIIALVVLDRELGERVVPASPPPPSPTGGRAL